MSEAVGSPVGWERALTAAEKVKERLRRATGALDGAGVAYAVVGGNAVAEWIARIDEDAVRNTRDVDLLIRRADFDAARVALEGAGSRPEYEHAAPGVDESERAAEFQVVTLSALVHMKLLSWRDKDRTHLRDMIGVGLIDATWPARLPAPLSDRLQQLLDNPNG